MKNKSQRTKLFITALRQMSVAAFAAVVLLAVPVAGNAQETSSSIGGVITDNNGNPLASAQVTVRNDSMGLTRTTTTNASGTYRLRNMPIGYDYTVSATASGYTGGELGGVSVNLGKTANVDMALVPSGTLDEVVVTASRPVGMQVALGPSATFGLAELQAAPAINRNITDVLRSDARIYVDESRGDINAVQCAGKNSRFNSLTVDGVRMNDSFGLNSNGYPTERMPFSYDAINQVAVELAPFDVQYGGFSACNINAVTKSGSNNFSGSAFYDYTSDSLRGDTLEGDDIESGDYTEKRYGVTFGGPIVKDKLFFFLAYEKLDGANLFDRGPIGSGAVNEVDVTQAELVEIARIAREVYFYDPGFIPASLPHEDEKLLLKFDWNISDQQRAVFTYTYNDGENFTKSDGDNNEFEFSNHLYERGAELISFGGSLYSDWTENFSTEIRLAHLEIDNRQISVGPKGFGEMRVELEDRVGLGDVDVYLGGDDSRQSNKLDYTVDTISLKGKYDLPGHSLTFGVEREELDVFNLFIQHTETEIRFDGIDNFRNGLADRVEYNNAPSHMPNDAAAVWGYEITTVFIQDEFELMDRLTLIAGLRYDHFTTGTAPPLNTEFEAEYGFPNTATVDGIGLLQPRVGFSYDLSSDTVIRGGVGLYSVGNPNVWLSNNYSANNVVQFGAREFGLDLTATTYEDIEADAPAGAGAGWGIPTPLHDAVSGGTGRNFEINYLDPNFDLPSEWKIALGVTHIFANDLAFTFDVLITEGQDTAMVLHGDLVETGRDADGYPIYDSPNMDSFVLTNSNKGDRSFGYSVGLAKSFDNGFDFTAGYSYSDAEDVQPMTSSVAFSNYQNRAFFDPQEDVRSRSNYNIEHRLTATMNWRKELFERSMLTVSLYGAANSGRPFSHAFNGTISPYGFTPFLDFRDNVLRPGVGRNAEDGSWWRKVDLRINLDLPGFREDDKASVFLVIDNLTNLINDDWGVLYQHNFPRTVEEGTEEARIGDASRYEIRFGAQYQF